jgi:hypothetical protein
VCSATLFLVTGTLFKNLAFGMHISDGLGAESNMHVESAIGFSTRWILRNHRRLSSDKAALCTRVHTLTRSRETAPRLLENVVLQMFSWSTGLRERNECRTTAKVEVQNHDVYPLGFPHVFFHDSPSPAEGLTGQACMLHHVAATHSCRGRLHVFPVRMAERQVSRMPMTPSPVFNIPRAARCRFTNSPFSLSTSSD